MTHHAAKVVNLSNLPRRCPSRQDFRNHICKIGKAYKIIHRLAMPDLIWPLQPTHKHTFGLKTYESEIDPHHSKAKDDTYADSGSRENSMSDKRIVFKVATEF